ncbi:hypothetical protein [Streptomyces sp. NPDC051576]|uniref:hypothetical protein n=1 Tax=Streptomyces sp. NPDC051576 TaxID=3155803 RepID=UPI0034175AD8
MFSVVLHTLEGSPLLGVLAFVALVGLMLLRQLLLFAGFKRALNRSRHDDAHVSLFAAFSAALSPSLGRRSRRSEADPENSATEDSLP